MEKEFVTYEQALALSDLGFKQQNYFAFYHKGRLSFENLFRYDSIKENPRNVDAPLKQQVFRWFREKYNLHHIVIWDSDTNNFDAGLFGELVVPFLKDTIFHTYEEAENACIDKLILIAQEHGKD